MPVQGILMKREAARCFILLFFRSAKSAPGCMRARKRRCVQRTEAKKRDRLKSLEQGAYENAAERSRGILSYHIMITVFLSSAPPAKFAGKISL